MSTYSDLYLKDGTEPTIFESDVFIGNFVDSLKEKLTNNTIHACYTEPQCICSNDCCDCDHDENFIVKKIGFELSSNCGAILSFELEHVLNTSTLLVGQGKKNKLAIQELINENETLDIKIFYLDEESQKETTLFYINRAEKEIKFGSPEIIFTILDDKISSKHPTIYIRMNYMQYRENDGTKSKFHM
jgi:hypothetical protein